MQGRARRVQATAPLHDRRRPAEDGDGQDPALRPPPEVVTVDQRLDIGTGELEVRVDRGHAGAERRPPLVFLHEGLGSVDLWRTFPDDVRHDVGSPTTVVYSRHGYGSSAVVAEPRAVTYMHTEADSRPAGTARTTGTRAAGADRPQRRRLDRPAVRRCRHTWSPDSSCWRPTCSSRTARSLGSRRPASPTRRATLPNACVRYHRDADSTFRGWNDVWLSPAFRSWNIEDRLPSDRLPDPAGPGRRRPVRHARSARRHRTRRRRTVPASRDPRRRPLPPPRSSRRPNPLDAVDRRSISRSPRPLTQTASGRRVALGCDTLHLR